MSENLDRLCKISIDLKNPVQSAAGFDCLLLVGDAPAAAKGAVPPVGVYSNIDEVTDVGWVATGDKAEPIGRAARIAFSQSPHPNEIYIAVRQETATEDGEGTEKESITDTLARATETEGWYVICPCELDDDTLKEMAEWTETHEKIMAFTTMDTTNPIGNLFFRSFGFCGRVTANQEIADIPADNYYTHVATVATCLCYDAGGETWANMVVNGITPSVFNSTVTKKLEEQNLSYVIRCANSIITQGGKVSAGEWVDLIRFRDWLKNDMAVRVCQFLIANPKVPYTDGGITGVENQMVASLKEGQLRKGIVESEFDDQGNEIPGYKTMVPLASSLTAEQRASRTLKNCKFAGRVAGAIHMVELEGSLTYTF